MELAPATVGPTVNDPLPLIALFLLVAAVAIWSAISPNKPVSPLATCARCGSRRYGWTRWFPIHPRCPLCGKR